MLVISKQTTSTLGKLVSTKFFGAQKLSRGKCFTKEKFPAFLYPNNPQLIFVSKSVSKLWSNMNDVKKHKALHANPQYKDFLKNHV